MNHLLIPNFPDYSRIRSSIDIDRLQASHVTLIGAGASFTLAANLIRSGLGAITLVDNDSIDPSNIARQDHTTDAIGVSKVQALARHLHRINPLVAITCLHHDFRAFSDEDVTCQFQQTDLFIFATDSFAAQARGNEVALQLRKRAIWIGLYPGGGAGEINFWYEGLPCFRCNMSRRYERHASGSARDPSSDGATIFDIQLLDSIAGQLAVGLLTRGSNNRYGRLIDQLGERNFLQLKIDPDWTLRGRDVVREHLGIASDCTAYVSFCTIARHDPDRGEPPCPDCQRFLGRMPAQTNIPPFGG